MQRDALTTATKELVHVEQSTAIAPGLQVFDLLRLWC
jgi:hypothetical protein